MSNNDVSALFASSVAKQGIEERANEAKGKGGGKGWLYAIAEVAGRLADKKAAEMEAAINGLPDDAKPSDMLKTQAISSEFQLMMNTFTNVVKTLGEANANTARKG